MGNAKNRLDATLGVAKTSFWHSMLQKSNGADVSAEKTMLCLT